jgi:hypothetical protein
VSVNGPESKEHESSISILAYYALYILRGLCNATILKVLYENQPKYLYRSTWKPNTQLLNFIAINWLVIFINLIIYYSNIKARFSFHLVYILDNTYLPLLVFRDVTHHLLSLRFFFLLFLSNRYPQLMVTKAATTVVLSSILTTTRLPICTSRQTYTSKVKCVICTTSLLELAQVLAKFRSSQVTRVVSSRLYIRDSAREMFTCSKVTCEYSLCGLYLILFRLP